MYVGWPYDKIFEAAPYVVTPLRRGCQPRTKQPVHKVVPACHLGILQGVRGISAYLSPEIWVTSSVKVFAGQHRRLLRSECEVGSTPRPRVRPAGYGEELTPYVPASVRSPRLYNTFVRL